MKHHRGTARAQDWVLAGVERETNRCFIVLCPGGKRTAAVPPASHSTLGFCLVMTIYTDGWREYQQLPDLGYTHSWVNHTLYFKDPVTGVHANRQEDLWKHIRAGVSGSRTLEDSFVDFIMRQHFTTGEKVRGRDRDCDYCYFYVFTQLYKSLKY